ncbi:MAG: glycosyltransferase [candidate division Zixibacteria bacterium]|nr:glycosyltransferase [candidate division Zixibacteria bacterium]
MGTDQTIKICHIASGDLWAGAEVQVYNMVCALHQYKTINVSVIVLNHGKLEDKLVAKGVPVKVLDENSLGFFEIVSQVKKYAEENRFEILHTHRYKENIVGGMVKKAGKVKYLVQTVHGLPEPFVGIKQLKTGFFSFINRRYIRKYVDVIHAVSSQIKTVLGDIVSVDKIRVIYNSINLDDIKTRKQPEIIRSEFNIDSGSLILGTVGRLVPIKGFDILLQSFEEILKDIPSARLIIVGDGPQDEELKKLAKSLGHSDKVCFTGYREDALEIINCMDIFVLSSYNEGVPTVVLEAMALNKPVVSTAVGGVPEVIVNNVSGLLVESGNPEILADACIRVLTDDSLRIRFERNARQVIIDKFTSTAQGKYVKDIYCNLARAQF